MQVANHKTLLPSVLIALAALFSHAASAGKSPGLAETPPMGWNSWNHFDCEINEQIIRDTAEDRKSVV